MPNIPRSSAPCLDVSTTTVPPSSGRKRTTNRSANLTVGRWRDRDICGGGHGRALSAATAPIAASAARRGNFGPL